MAKIVTLTKGGIEKLIKAAGTVSPTSQKLAQYDGNGCLATNDPHFALDCVNKSYLDTRLNDAYQEFLDLKSATKAFVVKMTAYDPVTGGRVNLPAPDTNEFPWIRRTTGNGGGHEYVLNAGNAYVIEMAMYGKAYFQSYDMFADGTGFWNLTTPNAERWKSEQSILFRKGGQPNVWLSHNGWVKEAAGIAILRITKIPGITI